MSYENAVALIGLSCRFPGAPNATEFWRHLCGGEDGISRFDPSGTLPNGVDPATARHPDFVPAQGVLASSRHFDREFFGYSAAEAASIDPQHRILLECAAQACDDAGIDPGTAGKWTGVYAGADRTPFNYSDSGSGSLDPALATQQIIGREKDFLATRIAYKLGLRGPAMTVQTACSTSLVAVHQACRALLGYECDVALAGGVSLLPETGGYLHQEGGILARDGYCRAFDADATGTVSSSGAGVVVLERYADAVEAGRNIVAVIRGTAVNNDGGEKIGYTAPSVSGQRDVIRMALAEADVQADDIGYVEAHGTGTPVGDPVEVAALTAAFRETTERKGYCLLGTVKANIGHTGAAAGVAGLIKTALMLQHRTFVPTPHFTRPNPALALDDSPFSVSTAHRPWDARGPRLAGVSSFGIGGTNVHAVLEEPPSADGRGDSGTDARGAAVLCLSARTPEALDTLREHLAERLEGPDAPPVRDVAHTLTNRRQFPHRTAVHVPEGSQAAQQLRTAVRGGSRAAGPPEAAFLFPGQGMLRAGQGRAAHTLLPVFREVFDECVASVRARFGTDLSRVLDPATDPAWLTDTRHQQLGLFVHGYALARQLAAWHVAPVAMLGHSIGEYVAATLAGVWDWHDALGLVWERGTAMREAPAGRMLALRLPAEEVGSFLREGTALAVAGTGQSVLSGPTEVIERLATEERAVAAGATLLDTAHAFHSPLMSGTTEALRQALTDVTAKAPQVPFVSALTGDWAEAARTADPAYWIEQLLGTVHLARGMSTLATSPANVLIELGPGDSLCREARRQGADAGTIALLGRDAAAEEAATLRALGQLWERGVDIPWTELPVLRGARVCSLPPHPMAPTVVDLPAPSSRPGPPGVDTGGTGDPTGPAPSRPPLARDAWAETVPAPPFTPAPGVRERPVVLFGEAPPGLADALRADGRPPLARLPWGPGPLAALPAGTSGEGPALVLAFLPAGATPEQPDDEAVLDELARTARRFGASLLLAGCGLCDIATGGTAAPEARALAAWVEHNAVDGLHAALVDLGEGTSPTGLPATDDGALAYAWHAGRWWARAPRPVAHAADAAPGSTTVGPGRPAEWTVVADGSPDGARFAADLAEAGLRVGRFVDLTPPADRTPAVRDAVAAAGEGWDTTAQPLTRRAGLGRDLDLYCAGLVGQQVLALSGLASGGRMGDEELRRAVDPDDRLPSLVGFCLRMLSEEGWLHREDGSWQAADDVAQRVQHALGKREALGRLPGLTRMLDHVTGAYADVFAGRRTPVSVLYPDAEGDYLHECLKDNHVPLDDNSAALGALRSIVRAGTRRGHDGGAGGRTRRLRVLEIGAGTGRLTWPLLTDWPERDGVEYHFTDVSPLIVRRAAARAAELGLPDMRFSTYDIGREPGEQGFVPGSYDLVLGYNVVHVAESIPTALRRLSTLLRPGGRLGLVEVTEIPRWSHVLWGLAPGWWDFGDELRTDSIHLDAKGWLHALADEGLDASPVPASLDSDHLVVMAARPPVEAATPAEAVRTAPAGPRPEGAADDDLPRGLLGLAGPDGLSQGARRWRELTASVASAAAWVVTEGPGDWRGRLERDAFDPDPLAPAWGHLDLSPSAGPAALAALLARGAPAPGRLRLSGPAPATVGPAPEAAEAPNAPASPTPPASGQDQEPAPGRRPARAQRDALAGTVAEVWCTALGTAAVADTDDFHQLGGDSLMLVQLVGLLRKRLGFRVPVAALSGELTFDTLVAAVRAQAPERSAAAPSALAPPLSAAVRAAASAGAADLRRKLTPLKEGTSGTPLFLVAPAAGSTLCYQHIVARLGGPRPVYGLELPGLDDGGRPLSRLQDIAAHHVRVVKALQPQGPYLLGGWSFGCMVAQEMTRLLEMTGERVELLVGIDGFLPPTGGLPVGALPSWMLPAVRLQAEAAAKQGAARLLSAVRPRSAGRNRPGVLGEVARIGEVAGAAGGGGADYVRVHNASITAMLRHRPKPVEAPLLLLKAGASAPVRERLARKLTSLHSAGVTVRPVPGDHWTVLGREHSPVLTAEISRALSELPC